MTPASRSPGPLGPAGLPVLVPCCGPCPGCRPEVLVRAGTAPGPFPAAPAPPPPAPDFPTPPVFDEEANAWLLTERATHP